MSSSRFLKQAPSQLQNLFNSSKVLVGLTVLGLGINASLFNGALFCVIS
jgi:hypothetical protein